MSCGAESSRLFFLFSKQIAVIAVQPHTPKERVQAVNVCQTLDFQFVALTPDMDRIVRWFKIRMLGFEQHSLPQ